MSTHAEPRPRRAPPLRLPTRYRPLRRLAVGGTATVWCAEDRTLGRRVAVKLLAEPYASDPEAVRRFKREARAAARLSSHPHVVTIFDVGEAPAPDGSRRPFLVMEHLAGGTVADALHCGAVTLDDAVRWLHQAASAIDHAHANGILHRDIKPGNLLLDCRRDLYVADFGLAQMGREDQLTHAGHVLGTASYLPPERALGRPATVASDLYSLAVTAFEMLTGTRPFDAQSYVARARQHLEEEPPRASRRNPHLPPAVDAVLARGMAKAPEQRWPSALAFAQAVEEAMAPAARPVAAAPLRRRRHRPPLALLAGAAASLLVLAAGAVWAFGKDAQPRLTIVPSVSRPNVAARTHSSRTPARTTGGPVLTAVSASSATHAPTAETLEARGHTLLVAGRYGEAVAVLRRAVAAAAPGSLTYAYALFDLGRALRLDGQPRAAVAVLMQRLRIPNQTSVVRAELQLALAALGGASAPSQPAAPAGAPAGHPAGGHGPRDHGHGPGEHRHGHGPRDPGHGHGPHGDGPPGQNR